MYMELRVAHERGCFGAMTLARILIAPFSNNVVAIERLSSRGTGSLRTRAGIPALTADPEARPSWIMVSRKYVPDWATSRIRKT